MGQQPQSVGITEIRTQTPSAPASGVLISVMPCSWAVTLHIKTFGKSFRRHVLRVPIAKSPSDFIHVIRIIPKITLSLGPSLPSNNPCFISNLSVGAR